MANPDVCKPMSDDIMDQNGNENYHTDCPMEMEDVQIIDPKYITIILYITLLPSFYPK